MTEKNNIDLISEESSRFDEQSSSNIIIKDKEELEQLKKDPNTVLGTYQRAKFTGFGTYGKYDINDRVNELMKQCKKEYPTIDNWLLWIQVVDYVLKEELNVENTTQEKAKELYENYMKERDKREYQSVQLLDENNNPIEVK